MTGKTQLTVDFFNLFRGNSSAYGLVHGECVRRELTFDLWQDHLFGTGSLGIYPTIKLTSGAFEQVLNDGTVVTSQVLCRWACTDIDLHGGRGVTAEEAQVQARNLVTALSVLGHTAWVEVTKSFGYHVWLFAEGWVDAAVMRNVMLLAHQLADVPTIEVNPKSVTSELGNYVNLPYARKWCDRTGPYATKGQRSRYVIDPDTGLSMDLGEFVATATARRSTAAQLHETASLYVPPPPSSSVALRPFSGLRAEPGADYTWSSDIEDPELRAAAEKLDGGAWLRFRDGPRPGDGRGFTLFGLGIDCRKSGLTPDEALLVLVDADWRWGKYMSGTDGHSNGIQYIEKIVRDVYG